MAPSRGPSFASPLLSGRQLGIRIRPSPAYHTRFTRRTAGFHTSRPHSFDLLEASIETIHGGVDFLHSSVGLPWYLTLPLTALILRTTVVLPLNLIAQRNRQQRAALTPKVQEARPELERKVMSKHRHLGPEKCTRMLAWELAKKREELRKEAGISRWQPFAPLLQLPVWLVAIETIRRMAGTNQGLLGMALGRQSGPSGPETQPAFLGTAETGQELVENTSTAAPVLVDGTSYNPLFEPSLSTGGCLWFPDLLSPDPMLILPFTLSAVMFASVSWEERLVEAAGIKRPRWNVGLTRGIKIIALAIGPFTLNMPAAIQLYWITSAATALAQKGVIDLIMPVDRKAVAGQTSAQAPAPLPSHAPSKTRKYVPLKKASRRN